MATESPLKILSNLGVRGTVNDGFRAPPQNEYGDGLAKELGMLLREHNLRESNEKERELNLYRSGSAPPSVQGSLAALGGLLSSRVNDNGGNERLLTEEEIRSHPAYLEYYYSHVNLNPRLPPPLLSREDWRLAQRLQATGSGLDRRIPASSFGGDGSSNKSLFSAQPQLPTHKEENEYIEDGKVFLNSSKDGLFGLSTSGLGSRRKSFAEFIQEDIGISATHNECFSRPSMASACKGDIEQLSPDVLRRWRKNPFAENKTASLANVHSSSANRLQNLGSQPSEGFASAVGLSLSRSATPEPQLIAEGLSASSRATNTVKYGTPNKETIANHESLNKICSEPVDLSLSFSGLNISSTKALSRDEYQHAHNQSELEKEETEKKFLCQEPSTPFEPSVHALKSRVLNETEAGRGAADKCMPSSVFKGQARNLHQQTLSPMANLFAAPVPKGIEVSNAECSSGQYTNQQVPNAFSPNAGLTGYAINPMLLTPMMTNYAAQGTLGPMFDNVPSTTAVAAPGINSRSVPNRIAVGAMGSNATLQDLYALNEQIAGNGLQKPVVDVLGMNQLHKTTDYVPQMTTNLNGQHFLQNYAENNYLGLLEFQKAYLTALLAQQQSQCSMPYLGKNGNMSSGYAGNTSYGFSMPFPVNTIGSPVAMGSPMLQSMAPNFHNDRIPRYSSLSKSSSGGIWNSEKAGDSAERQCSSLLNEFKSNKNRCFELSDIIGHVTEFSADQIGSRFIQQKLEIASLEEKNMIFREIFPEALILMTDVFGNYVLQKFFEHGTANQRRDLADLLSGHVLTLSLQMYGCRVIQKAVEVVDMDQKIKLVQELDGHVMRCVRDQNGNHVIQKCIECVPEDKIYFITSTFIGQVVALSMHPYGCRVVQRVLEHCKDEKIQSVMMDEILQCVCALAQDQYGNYVIQHVLERGMPHERASLINKLAGQIVQMSQQKFASNVIEKCLQFGGPTERQVLINEMLGSNDDNEPLQAMMKDQFANYVVQKVLETCDDQQRALILSRIKVHLNALKKYTYGKHIVARVEKLVAAGEKRSGTRSNNQL
eukprot:TRINITY_DN13436_c0_g1_i1.p1 TRINITY_DN13436_c0_g1~~TRINITY_DN13436_c0_g1_i1.p1  ORF type:complete len:1053 (+),score=221.39 TRINITY_DN13436_c0_g1_i1:301-3459(+)